VTPEFWEAQTAAQAIPDTGMAVINDIGDLADIHPKNKQDVGRRLALLALAGTYGQKVVSRGPTFRDMEIKGATLRVTFDNVGAGLISRDGKPITWFEIIDADEGGFVKAKVELDGASAVLSAPEVRRPVAVRFAWHMLAEPNLSNKEGLPANSFRAGDVPKRDMLTMHVPESKDYTLVYDLDLGKLGPQIRYDADNRSRIAKPFDRIAYMVELTDADGKQRFAYVSMDAFTKDLGKIGIPTLASGAFFRQNLANMNVVSNADGVANGVGLGGGNIEFWPSNYGPPNSASVPNASSSVWDFGDEPGDPQDGYGCMQVHNHDAKQTVFAINQWKAGGSADIGIGNSTGETRDWTFARNAGSYIAKRLRVLVRCR
jgi:sialate O-acetylesterase